MAVEPTDEQRARWGIPGAVVAGAFVARDSLGYGLVLVVGLAALFSMVRNLRGNTDTKWPWHPPGWLQVVLVFTMLMLAYLSKALNFYGSVTTSVLVAGGLTFFWVLVGYVLPWWSERR